MVKHIASFGIVSFVLLAACGAVCQDARQGQLLPDAPSALGAGLGASQAGLNQTRLNQARLNDFVEEAHSQLKVGVLDASASAMRRGGLIFSEGTASHQKNPEAIFHKYLYPSSVKQPSGDRSASGGSLMSRATSAASRTVVTRDVSGKGRLNTSYLLRTLTVVAKDAASTPYWRRSLGEPFNAFGSTVGNDAGMNLWHEFRPGIERLVKSHTPMFISKIEERIGSR